MIELKELYLKNFLSHVDTTLPLEEYSGLVLIEGQSSDGHYSSNGSGKSTLLEGIVYALTGNTLRGVSVNDVINRNYKKDTQATLCFRREDEEYVVSRYRKDSVRGDSLLLTRAGDNISKRVNKDTQALLEDILNISYDILVSTMLLGEGLSSRFTQLSDPGKKSLIESTLNLQYDMSEVRAKANSVLTQLRLDLSNLTGKLSTMRELSTLDVEATKEKIVTLQSRSSQLSYEIERLKKLVESSSSERSSISSKIQIISNALIKHNSIEEERLRLGRELAKYVLELQNIQSADIPRCSTCHQLLSTPESIQAVQSSYTEKMNEIEQSMRVLREQVGSLPDPSILKETKQRLEKSLTEIDESVSKSTASISTLTNEYWSIIATIKQLQSSIVDHEHSEFDIAKLEEDEARLKKDIDKYEYFYKLFSPTGIIVNILSDAIEYINSRLATYSSVLLEKDYRINFVKGKISLLDGKGSSYQSLSNGEKRRLDIAIQFSLHDYVHTYCGNSVDTMFIDEILDTLDDVGIENIITVLRLKLDYCKLSRIFVISHNSELKSYFDKVITVIKDLDGNSKIF